MFAQKPGFLKKPGFLAGPLITNSQFPKEIMLPTELLSHRQNGESIVPHSLKINNKNLSLARAVIECFQEAIAKPQKELDKNLLELEGDSPNYRVQRALAHLLRSGFTTFEVVSPLEPLELREKVFAAGAETIPGIKSSAITLEKLADKLSQELKREVLPDEITKGLYADLQENRIMTEFEAPTPEELLHRYNLSQVQGIFYRASHIRLNAHRNDPGEYKLLFRYLKLFQLMTYIEGDADTGFTLTIDGPYSLFKPSTRYGLALAKMLPALLHVTKWSLHATLQTRDRYTGNWKTGKFTLNSDCGLVSHYPPGKPYDSMIEASFAERWQKTKTDWKLEREVDLIPIPGSVMIPDFRLVHPEGKVFLLEIVGYWRSEYLKKKFLQVKTAECDNLILAVSERLNLEKAGVEIKDVPVPIVWFKDKLLANKVLEVLEGL
jgi:predicted nuclease of restriction endonuclease-like RecB superfamily